MKCKLLLVLFFFTSMCLGQEICDNAIDDDGDGLTDLNDPDCQCANQVPVNSIIPNASFEEYAICPYAAGQLNFCTGWLQATNGTTDYMNTCNFLVPAVADALGQLSPFPDGNAITGALFTPDFKEYLGSCTTAPMQAGTNYQLTFAVAALPINGDGLTCNNGVLNLEPVYVTLYGTPNCAYLPAGTYQSPDTAGTNWVALGSVLYTPQAHWSQLTITFNPDVAIKAIMLGAPQTLPQSYYQDCLGYFLFDNLTLNKASVFGITIEEEGLYCDNNLVLKANPGVTVSSSADYQWYKNGVAIIGATANSYSVASVQANLTASFRVKVTNGAICYISVPHYINAGLLTAPLVTATDIDCTNTTGTITVATPAAQYSIDNGITWMGTNVFTLLPEGTYFVKTKTVSGCESMAQKVVVATILVPQPVVSDVALCKNVPAAPLSASGTNLLWYTSLSDTTPDVAPIPLTTATGITPYYVSQTINSCESTRAVMFVSVYDVPDPPVVSAISYCQGSTAQPLTATGSNLLWYNDALGGIGMPLIIPSAREAGTFNYYVSQSVNSCESSRAQLVVTIYPTPPEPETEPYLYYPQYAHALPLMAVGENIKWYDSQLQPLSTVPVVTTNKLGLATYYVSQTIDGCESSLKQVKVIIVANFITITYPHYFTPNGDGSHETWNVYPPDMDIMATVYIYDRYGKLLARLFSPGTGWDGKLNEYPLPAEDYWFKAIYTEYGIQKEVGSHFSLIR